MQKFWRWIEKDSQYLRGHSSGLLLGAMLTALLLRFNGMKEAADFVFTWVFMPIIVVNAFGIFPLWWRMKQAEKLRLEKEEQLLHDANEQLKNSDLNWGNSR